MKEKKRKNCAICGKPAYAKGRCRKHYEQNRRRLSKWRGKKRKGQIQKSPDPCREFCTVNYY